MIHAVTGAFGYTGKYITQRLLAQHRCVMTLTNSPHRANAFDSRVQVCPFFFEEPDKLARQLEGVSVLYNTYWVRFNHREFSHAQAIRNTLTLFEAAGTAGVRRVVHISITNPSEHSALEYFRGKARLERALVASGISYAILRPAVLFGMEDILINNIAWMLRVFPVFGVFGDGDYKLQPIFVDDLAELAVAQGRRTENCIMDAVGPETFRYTELVRTIGRAIGRPRPVIRVPAALGLCLARLVGCWKHDVLITRGEIDGLMQGLLATDSPPAGRTLLTAWLRENASTLGMRYANEMARRRDRQRAYGHISGDA